MKIRNIRQRRNSYLREKIFTGKGRGHTSRPQSWWIIIEQVRHKWINLLLSQSYAGHRTYHIKEIYHQKRESKGTDITSSRLTAWIG
jgi:hypothetical protein